MERLTVKYKDKLYDTFDPIDIADNEYSKINYEKMLVKLGEYEDAEEQGLLLRLPCPIGATVYVHTPFCEICESDYPCEFCTKSPFVSETKFDYEMIPMVGECVFLTREEAEKALAEVGV